jgi:hypothetical protein
MFVYNIVMTARTGRKVEASELQNTTPMAA